MASHRVIEGPVVLEIPKIKGSRFIASVAHVLDEQRAKDHIAAVRKEQHAARHVCWAFRVGETGEHTRFSDDGEPSGSAGRPILAAIEGAGLTFVVVAVTRYFGGTKLGVGGLVRAYGGAAKEGLAEAGIRLVVPTLPVSVEVPYDQLGTFETFCVREGVSRPEGTYGDGVSFVFDVPELETTRFAARLVDAGSGRISVAVGALGEEPPSKGD